jgi:hypothetical protein
LLPYPSCCTSQRMKGQEHEGATLLISRRCVCGIEHIAPTMLQVHQPAGAALTDWELDTPCSLPLPRRRCTSLQELEVSDMHYETSVHFKGHGASPAKRRHSLQQDLAALTAPASVFDNASWPLCTALVTMSVAGPLFADALPVIPLAERVRSALATTSLVSLSIRELPDHDLPLLYRLSNLRSLTKIRILVSYSAPQLPPLPLHLPSSLLPRLTRVALHHVHIDSGQPMVLGALEALDLHDCSMDSIEALSGCPKLTRLRVDCTPCYTPSQFLSQYVSSATSTPAGGKLGEGVRSLRFWTNDDNCAAEWVEQLRGITSLSLQGVDVSPELCRCVLSRCHTYCW